MAYIKERGNNTFLVRISLGIDNAGHAIQKSKTFHPSSPNLSKSKIQKELNAFIHSFELESSNDAKPIEKNSVSNAQADTVNPTPLFCDYCVTYTKAKQRTMAPTTWQFNEKVMNTLNDIVLAIFIDSLQQTFFLFINKYLKSSICSCLNLNLP